MCLRVPRWLGLLVWPVQLAMVHVDMPVGLARSGRRRGWRNGPQPRPGPPNAAGLVPSAVGGALIVWAVARHCTQAPDRSWRINRNLEPEYLLTDGPYRVSRNPMHLGGILVWSGWAIWFGSARVAAGLVVMAGVMRAGIAWEETTLERRWGDEWRTYAARTPRWLSAGSTRPPPKRSRAFVRRSR
jgi:protein-S-isoprenylcysteine O-methyltransferase Ste14